MSVKYYAGTYSIWKFHWTNKRNVYIYLSCSYYLQSCLVRVFTLFKVIIIITEKMSENHITPKGQRQNYYYFVMKQLVVAGHNDDYYTIFGSMKTINWIWNNFFQFIIHNDSHSRNFSIISFFGRRAYYYYDEIHL